jgi:hypothetical protein
LRRPFDLIGAEIVIRNPNRLSIAPRIRIRTPARPGSTIPARSNALACRVAATAVKPSRPPKSR